MVRTQIQLPDELHARLKREAQEEERSLAEVVRRAAEEYLERRPRRPLRTASTQAWKLPIVDLGGPPRRPVEEFRELANPEPEV